MRILIFLCAILFSGLALACQCAYEPMSDNSVKAAKNIFVFRLISAEIANKASTDGTDSTILATIQIVDVVRGSAAYKKIYFSNHWCCGSRLDVGHFYAAFTSTGGVSFSGNTGNLLDLGNMYYPEIEFRKNIPFVLTGKMSINKAFANYDINRLEQVPPPPPPPTPHIKKRHN
jgi:hypothetical protein